MTDFVLAVRLTADDDGFQGELRIANDELGRLGDAARRAGEDSQAAGRGLDQTGRQAQRTTSEVRRLNAEKGRLVRRFAEAARGALSFRSALATAAGVGGLLLITQRALSFANQLQDQADLLGLNVEKLQELRFAAASVGISQQRLDATMEAFLGRLGQAAEGSGAVADAYRRLQVAIFDGQGELREQGDILRDLADAFAAIEDPARRAALAREIFGRSGVQFVNTLAQGSAGLDEMARKARAMGAVMEADLVAKAARANTQLGQLQTAFANAFNVGLISPFIDEFGNFHDDIVDARFQDGIRMLGETLGGLIKLMVENADVVIAVMGALTGAKIGSRFGPWGAGIGAAAGGAAGWFLRFGEAVEDLEAEIAAGQEKLEELLDHHDMLVRTRPGVPPGLRAARDQDIDDILAAISVERQRLSLLRQRLAAGDEGGGLQLGVRAAPPPPERPGSAGAAAAAPPGRGLAEVLDTARQWQRAFEQERERAREVLGEFRTDFLRAVGAEVEIVQEAEAQKLRTVEDFLARRLITEHEAALARDQIQVAAAVEVEEIERRRAEAAEEAAERSLRASRRFADGAKRALQDYVAASTDAGAQAERALTSSMRSLEDAIVDSLARGTLSFRDFADTVIRELIRIQVQANITAPIADFLGGLSLFGGGNASGGAPVRGGYPIRSPSRHQGGPVDWSGPGRTVDAAVFAGAPRMHRGGMIGRDEVPIIAQRGEVIGWPDQMRRAFGGEPRVEVQIVNHTGARAETRETRGADGTRQLIVTIGREMARDVAEGGPLGRQIERSFGMRRQGRP